jgi:hypothetical protein
VNSILKFCMTLLTGACLLFLQQPAYAGWTFQTHSWSPADGDATQPNFFSETGTGTANQLMGLGSGVAGGSLDVSAAAGGSQTALGVETPPSAGHARLRATYNASYIWVGTATPLPQKLTAVASVYSQSHAVSTGSGNGTGYAWTTRSGTGGFTSQCNVGGTNTCSDQAPAHTPIIGTVPNAGPGTVISGSYPQTTVDASAGGSCPWSGIGEWGSGSHAAFAITAQATAQ